MLKIIASLCTEKRLEYLIDRLKSNDSAVLVVPEQFLFETERSMYRLLGARKIAVTEITGFSKLAADVIKIHGEPKFYADDIVKGVTMYKTLRRLNGTSGAAYPAYDSARRMLDIVADMKSAAITSAQLADSLVTIEDDTLLTKLTEISEVYSAYQAALDADFMDKLDDCRVAAELIRLHDCFRGKQVFINEFDGFSASQIGLIKAIEESAEGVEILLRTDSKFGEYRSMNSLIARLEREISADFTALGGESNNPIIELWTADNVSDEAELVASTIRRLITKEGYILNEIAVLTCDGVNPSRLKEAMAEHEISCYADLPEPILGKSMTRFIISALNATDLDTSRLMSYIRSGFVRVKREGESRRLSLIDMDLIERNAVRYALTAREWGKQFPETNKYLREIEQLRKEVVTPLINLRKSCKNKTGAEITEILCEFLLDTMQLQKTVLGLCDGDISLTNEFRQLWDLVIEVFESLHAALKGEPVSLSEYTELLTGVFGTVNIAKPPQVLDSVVIGDLARSRMSGVKVAFVVGANLGCFPKSSAVTHGAFTGREIESLAESGLEVSARLEERYDFERLMVNKAMTLPSEKLYICAPLSNAAWEELLKAPIFPHPDDENIINHYTSKTQSTHEKTISSSDHEITPDTAQKLFTLERFSPSAIESMMGCAFKYFCRYGLSIDIPALENEDEPIAAERGNIIHYCLERALREPRPLFDSELEGFVESCIKEYRAIRLPAGFAQSKRQGYIHMSFKPGIVRMLRHIREEFEGSVFRPAEFEKQFEFDMDGVKLYGKIDRLDRHGNMVRVIDYKSKSKELSFPSVFYGLDMQMLLYLFSECSGGAKPDSAFYLPADGARVSGSLPPGANDFIRREHWYSSHSQSGIIVSGSAVHEFKTEKKITTLSEAAYERLREYCGKLINTRVNQVKRGKITAIPVKSACDYCEFGAVCNKQEVVEIDKQAIESVVNNEKSDC